MLYEYKAVSENGKVMSAKLDADSLQDAKAKLLRKQTAVLEIKAISEKAKGSHFTKKETLSLTKELSRLLQAGLPLYESLEAMQEKYKGHRAQILFLSLADQIKAGVPFSNALQKHPLTFDLLYVSMVANAEKTGRLAEDLQHIATLLSRQIHVKSALQNALIYPAMLLSFCLVVLASLLFYVVPSLKELFDGHNLHPFTALVFFVSDAAVRSKMAIGLVIITALGFAFAIPFFPKAKNFARRLLCSLPLFKDLLAKAAFVRFARASSTLLEGGLPLVAALDAAKPLMRHVLLESALERVTKGILEGQKLSQMLLQEPLFPALIPRMLSIAEDAGNLPVMMRQIAEIYEEDLEKTLLSFTAIAQPLLLLILGAIIGFVLLAVLLPLTDVSSFAGS